MDWIHTLNKITESQSQTSSHYRGELKNLSERLAKISEEFRHFASMYRIVSFYDMTDFHRFGNNVRPPYS
jgi:hypothetical protein